MRQFAPHAREHKRELHAREARKHRTLFWRGAQDIELAMWLASAMSRDAGSAHSEGGLAAGSAFAYRARSTGNERPLAPRTPGLGACVRRLQSA